MLDEREMVSSCHNDKMICVYIDHNIVDDVSKGNLALKHGVSFVWVYSNDHFNEVQPAGKTHFLNVLQKLRAQ